MNRTARSILAIAALFTFTLPAHAQNAAAECTVPVVPEGELAAWAEPSALPAAGNRRGLAAARLPVGQAAQVKLLPTPDVTYPLRPEKPGGSVSYGGLIEFRIAEAGTYRVALGTAAWIDVLFHGKGLVSKAHGHGPECSGIRKIVDFDLKPGRYTLQISANGEPQTTVLIARAR
ncbi:MAG: homogentisate 1,2-dioxygenase [Novosphingobium sp.]|nr:homogentisate 1,2-dioxygenase [Novosphingobium sp.]